MKLNYINNFFVLLIVMLTFSSCEKDLFTNQSTLVPTNPTLSVTGIDAAGYNVVEGGQKYVFGLELSEAQIVDVKLSINQTAGDAISGVDYSVASLVTVPAGATSTSVELTIIEDNLVEDTETFTLTFGDDRTTNSNVTTATANFTIVNAEGGDLHVDFSWATDAADAIGIDLDPTAAVDMRFLVFHADTLFAVADGAGFESFVINATDPDGVYVLATDIYATVNAGDFNNPITLDLGLEFNQDGRINGQTMSFPGAMTNQFTCDLYNTEMATITKSAGIYTIAEDLSNNVPSVVNEVIDGTWGGTDAYTIQGGVRADYASSVTVSNDVILGLNEVWMTGFWGEQILQRGDVTISVSEGVVTIPKQYIFTTLYDAEEYPYEVEGTGTISRSCDGYIMTIEYTLDQEGFDVSGWANDNGYQNEPYFTASLSL